MKASLKSTLDQAMNQWLEANDAHEDRPRGFACEDLGELMASAASAVYDASHAGAIIGAENADILIA